jgi:hypothetical protein
MTQQEAIEWVNAHTDNDVFVRTELEAAYNALASGGVATKNEADLWSDDDLWLFCRAEVYPPNGSPGEPPICIADIRDVLVKLARSGVFTDVCSHACLRAASLLVRLRAAIFMRPYDPRVPVSDVEAVAAYKKLREMLHGE